RSRIFGSYGRYYLPVAANTAFRMGAQERYFSEYFLLEGYTPGVTDPYDSLGQPVQLGDQIVDWTDATACPAAAPGTSGVSGYRCAGAGTAAVPVALIAQTLESTARAE